jgi:hypothetical protein
MTAENFDATINELTARHPFQVFVIELNGGTRYEIDHPRAIINRNGLAMFFRPGGGPVILDHDSVNQIFLSTANELAGGADAAS